MAYKMMHLMGRIDLGNKVRITERGTQFEVQDKVTRDILVENKNAIDITDGIPQTIASDSNILALQLEEEKRKNQELAKKFSELRQQVKNSGNNSDYVDTEKEALKAELDTARVINSELHSENVRLKAELDKLNSFELEDDSDDLKEDETKKPANIGGRPKKAGG